MRKQLLRNLFVVLLIVFSARPVAAGSFIVPCGDLLRVLLNGSDLIPRSINASAFYNDGVKPLSGRDIICSDLLKEYNYSAIVDPNYPDKDWTRVLTLADAEGVFSFSNAKVFEYELILAKETKLPLEVVVALSRNFFHGKPTLTNLSDGAIGVSGKRDTLPSEGKFWLDVNRNLTLSYLRLERNLVPGNISGDLLASLGGMIFTEQTVVSEGKFATKINVNAFRERRKVAKIDTGSVHPSVRGMMAEYGIEIKSGRIVYPDFPDYETALANPNRSQSIYNPRFALDALARDLNTLVTIGAPRTFITAYAVQKFLIIHPFKDHNGRSARLLGQVLFEKLMTQTNPYIKWNEIGYPTIIFGMPFHQELNYSFADLAKKISGRTFEPSADLYYGMPTMKVQGLGSLYDQIVQLSLDMGADINIVNSNLRPILDQPFRGFSWGKDAHFDYAALPPVTKSKSIKDGKFVFWGTSQDPAKFVPLKFEFGLSKASSNDDLLMQVKGQDGSSVTNGGGITNFFPTSEEMPYSLTFALQALARAPKTKALIFIIDPTGAQYLNVPNAVYLVGSRGFNISTGSAYVSEKEIAFDGRIAPFRFVAALEIEKVSSGPMPTLEVRRVYLNGNYKPRE